MPLISQPRLTRFLTNYPHWSRQVRDGSLSQSNWTASRLFAGLVPPAIVWRQINRGGHPMMWPIFWPDDVHFANHQNTRHPSQDLDAIGKYIGDKVSAVVAASGTSDDPQGYGQTVARELLPDVLPYVVGTPATYSFAARNGRTMADNAPEAMLSLVSGMAVPSGLKPSVAKNQRDDKFPYVVRA